MSFRDLSLEFGSPVATKRTREESPSPIFIGPTSAIGRTLKVARRNLFDKDAPLSDSQSSVVTPLPIPDFDRISSVFTGTKLKTPPTPFKRKPGKNLWDDSPWTHSPIPVARGSMMTVYDSTTADNLVVKIPEKLTANSFVREHLQRIVAQQKIFKEKGFPVADLVNAETAVADGCIVMEKFDTPFIPASAPQNLKQQYKELIQKSWDEKLVIDLKPDNIFVKNGELIIVDWDATGNPRDREELEAVLRQAIRMTVGQNEELRDFFTPQGSNLWEGIEP